MPANYDEIINKLAEDPEFLDLPEADQDMLVNQLAQERLGKIPNPMNFIQNAIKASGYVSPVGQAAAVPGYDAGQTIFQTAQGAVGNAPQNIVENPVTTAASGLPGVQAKSGIMAGDSMMGLLGKFGIKRPIVNNAFGESGAGSSGYSKELDLSGLVEPSSQQGKIVAGVGNMASGAVDIAAPSIMANTMSKTGKAVSKGVDALNPLSTKQAITELGPTATKERVALARQSRPVIQGIAQKQKKAKGIKELIGESTSRKIKKVGAEKGKALEAIDEDALDAAFLGAEDVQKSVTSELDSARREYRAMIENTDTDVIDLPELVKILDDTIEAKGILGKQFPSPAEQRLIQARFDVAGRIPEAKPSPIINPRTNQPFPGEKPDMPKLQNAVELKNYKNEVLKLVGAQPDLEGEFLSRFSELLKSKGIDDFGAANKKYSRAYDLAEKSEPITEQKLRAIAKDGPVSRAEKTRLKSVEDLLGTSTVKKAEELSEKAKKVSAEFQLKEDEIKKIGDKRLQKIEEYLEGLGKRRQEVVESVKRRSEEITLKTADKRMKLNKKFQDTVRNDIIVGTLLALAGGKPVYEKAKKVMSS